MNNSPYRRECELNRSRPHPALRAPLSFWRKNFFTRGELPTSLLKILKILANSDPESNGAQKC